MEKSKRKIGILIASVTLVLVLLVGITYAYFSSTASSNARTVQAGTLRIEYATDALNTVRLSNISPIYDNEITTKASKIAFTVTNTGTSNAYVEISLKDIVISNELKNSQFKWALYSGNNKISDGNFNGIGTDLSLIVNEEIASTNSKSYQLYIWISETGTDQSSMMDKSFSAKIKIDGNQYAKQLAAWTLTEDNDNNGIVSVGDLITSKKKTTEQFYVIGIDGDTVSLLAKYNLKSDGSEQDTTGANNACVFSSTNYWSSYSGSYPLNLNDYEIPSTATSIVTTAVDYGESLDVETGRLMKVEEVVALGGSMSSYLTSGCTTNGYTFINTQNYWLGSAGSSHGVWGVVGRGSDLDNYSYNRDGDFVGCGVRPVIEVSASDIL